VYYKPLLEAVQKDFAVLSIREPHSFFYSIIGFQDHHWFLKTETSFVHNGKIVLEQLSNKFRSAICLFAGKRVWLKNSYYFGFLDHKCPFDPSQSISDLDPTEHHQCFVQVLNNCFDDLVKYEDADQLYKAQKKVDIPVLEYFLNVPYEEKDAAKQVGAQWSEAFYPPRYLNRWYIDIQYIQDIRPFLRWANPKDHPFLLDLCERRNKFEEIYGKARQEAKENFEASKTAVIKAFLETKKKQT